MVDARRREGGSKKIFELAGDFLDGDGFDPDIAATPLAAQTSDFLAALQDRPVQPLAEYEKLIKSVYGRAPTRLIKDPAFTEFRNKIADSLIALKLIPEKRPRLLAEYARLQRGISIVERIVAKDEQLAELVPQSLVAATISLPEEIFPLPIEAKKRGDPAPPDDRVEEIARLNQEIAKIEQATDEVLTLGAQDLKVVGPASKTAIGVVTDAPVKNVSLTLPTERASLFAAPAQDIARESVVVIKEASFKALSKNTRAVLTAVKISPENGSLGIILDNLENEAFRLQQELDLISLPPDPPQFLRLGKTTIPVNLPGFPGPDGIVMPEAPGIPTTVGNIRPSHVGRLLRALQHIIRYEAEEIAHVENVVIGESKNRETAASAVQKNHLPGKKRLPGKRSAICRPRSGWNCSARSRTRLKKISSLRSVPPFRRDTGR